MVNLGLIGTAVGIAIIVIGVLAIIISSDEFAFIRGMMLIITGILIFGLSFRLRVIQKRGKGRR